jgi:hypothetical protein
VGLGSFDEWRETVLDLVARLEATEGDESLPIEPDEERSNPFRCDLSILGIARGTANDLNGEKSRRINDCGGIHQTVKAFSSVQFLETNSNFKTVGSADFDIS